MHLAVPAQGTGPTHIAAARMLLHLSDEDVTREAEALVAYRHHLAVTGLEQVPAGPELVRVHPHAGARVNAWLAMAAHPLRARL